VGHEKSFQKTTIDFLLSCPTSSEDFVSRSVIAKNTQEEELDTKENTVDASLVFIFKNEELTANIEEAEIRRCV